jgi:DNA-binding PucR family transcriptional regulator
MPTVIPDTWVLPWLIALSVTVKVDPTFTVEADAASAPVKSPSAAWADGAAASNPATASAAAAASRAARIPGRIPRDAVLSTVWPIVVPFLVMPCPLSGHAM